MALTQVAGGMIAPSTTLTTPIVATTMGVGGATPANTGAGITFPVTQSASSNAKTLDDYEEGTWTPLLQAASSNPTVSYTTQIGAYTKVGRVVQITGRIQINSITGGSGAIRISGLPFASAYVNVGANCSWISGLLYAGSGTWAQPYFESAVTYICMASSASGTGQGATQIGIGNVGSIFDMAFSFTYTTT